MEEEKAAAYYDELSRKGEGAARFKQGLGFSSASSNEPVPSRGSALVSSSSFLSSFVRASSPSKTTDFQKQAQLESIQNKLKKKPKDDQNQGKSASSRVSNVKDIDRHSRHRNRSESRSRSPKHSRRRSRSRSPGRNTKRRSRSRSRERGKDRHSRRRSRSRSRNRDAKHRYRSKSRSRSRSRDRDRYREKEKQRRRRSRSVSAEDRGRKKDQRSDKVGKDRTAMVDYTKLIEGYEDMTPAERVKAKMKLQLSETAQKDETKGMGSGWERFDFDKDAPLDDEEIEAAEDDTALVKHIGKSFRFSAVETRREEQIKAAHDEAIFGGPSHPTLPPSTETDDEAQEGDGEKVTFESAPVSSLISGQVLSMQQGSWRDRARRS